MCPTLTLKLGPGNTISCTSENDQKYGAVYDDADIDNDDDGMKLVKQKGPEETKGSSEVTGPVQRGRSKVVFSTMFLVFFCLHAFCFPRPLLSSRC